MNRDELIEHQREEIKALKAELLELKSMINPRVDWKVVPEVPTMQMLDAKYEDGECYIVEADEYYFPDRNNARAFAARVYERMLATAPKFKLDDT